MARSTSSLRDWLKSLGEYRQLQFMQSPVGAALNIIHEQFIGKKTASTDADRKKYHQMKCCPSMDSTRMVCPTHMVP